jgi:hypothetical protein
LPQVFADGGKVAREIKGFEKIRLAMLAGVRNSTDVEKLSRRELRRYLEERLDHLDTQIVILSRSIAMEEQVRSFGVHLPKDGQSKDEVQDLDYLLATRAAIVEVLEAL